MATTFASFDAVPVDADSVSVMVPACSPPKLAIPPDHDFDSHLLITRPDRDNWRPNGARALPDRFTWKMSRPTAELVAVEDNRLRLSRMERPESWAIVVYIKGGFAVMRVRPPTGWRPVDEYDTPPTHSGPTTSGRVRRAIVEFNQEQMLKPGPVEFWAVLCKPIRRPDRPPMPFCRLSGSYDVGVGDLGDDEAEDIVLRVWNCNTEEEALQKAEVFLDAVHKRGAVHDYPRDLLAEGGAE
ncbi:MAG: hypothetical protein ACF8TS_04185 [Maioricimonas sp. JB049]